MNKKLFVAKTRTGHIIIHDASLSYLETKLDFTLNDLVDASLLKVGEELKRKIKIKTTSEIYESLCKSDKRGNYLMTVERVL